MSSDARADQRAVFAAIFPVEDFESWRNVEGLDGWLAEAQVESMTLYRGADDSNEVMAVLELPSLAAAEALVTHDELRTWFDRAGISIYPAVFVGRKLKRVDYRD